MPRIKSFAFVILLGIAAVGLTATPARATLISADDAVFGVASITVDDVNNLEWLDLTLSTNRSFVDVSRQFRAGGDFEGWRHATEAEILLLLSETGVPLGLVGDNFFEEFADFLLFAPVTALQQLIGVTAFGFGSCCIQEKLTQGFYDDGVDPGSSGFFSISATLTVQPGTDFGQISLTQGIMATSIVSIEFGNVLVRDRTAVPEPGTLAIFGLGLAGLGIMRRRRKRTI